MSGIDEDLLRHTASHGRVSSTQQLAALREQLEQVAVQLSSSPLPPKPQRLRGIGRVITDSWPYDNPLASLILEAEQLYLKA
ncbi:hypothetical protein [Streptomyces sp. L2]|uniref:hypothetical protein n=1 Tax=Streptomyces sp. L2 TaxID=2162665 RepID=UPI0010113270|nr:hypothetical protein [Streptomyces sp. L2]